jgi:hypothetical protein
MPKVVWLSELDAQGYKGFATGQSKSKNYLLWWLQNRSLSTKK